MKKHPSFINILFISLFSFINVSTASDIEREKLLADAIKDSIIIGDVVSLKAGDTEFIGLLNKETDVKSKGVALILHGMGSNPNAPQLIHPLRDNLAQYGWSTLAIQLPILSHEAPMDDYIALVPESAPRIEASLNYLKENFPNQPCTMVAHSLGAVMAINFLASKEGISCDALVLIGLPTLPSKTDETNTIVLLEKVKIPTLDIYGSQDLPSVIQMASTRKTILSKNNALNRQQETQGADHLFTGLSEPLALSIHSWLTNVTQQR
jgi:predicted alpha/beta-hydrolase family hydrolase